MTYFTRHLKPGEETIEIVRPHLFGHLWSLALGVVLVLVPFFFMFFLLSRGMRGLVTFLILVAIGSLTLVRGLFLWRRNGVVVTPERLMDFDQRGLLYRAISEVPLSKIADVSYVQKGIGATLVGYGTVTVHTSGDTPDLEIRSVKDPNRVREMIAGLAKVPAAQEGKDEVSENVNPKLYTK
ncbi:MAG: PH domain-containing protein [Candidatus Kerfeldbacteria bacterium]|nr:PH domain-containing protein [Candidatus Kerfeldbacteria bacterium]